jgi:transposase InsO family protein
MPWKETDVVKERVKFLLEWESRWDSGAGRLNFAELCREFGVSRQVGYEWLERYRRADHDLGAAVERSRRPLTSPTKVADDIEEFVVAARKLHPTWGPKKLRAWALHHRPDVPLPAPSTIGEILLRRGLTQRRKLRRPRSTSAARQPFADVTGANATWCADFKGHFRTGDGLRCYPLTIVDAHSRFLVRCEGILDPDGREVQRICDSAFQEFGLPGAIRSDNGPPFATVGAGGLSKLSVWWLRLGIRLERITPGKPQENGRQERFHRTLKAETAMPPKASLRAQQRAFDLFRHEYNESRPHEALGQKPPATFYELSPRRYPRPLHRFAVDSWDQRVRVDKHGYIPLDEQRLFLSTALAHEDVVLRRVDIDSADATWDVVFGPLSVGALSERSNGWKFFPSKGRLADQREVSGMSSD